MQNVFQTQNRALAITLATCGVPFARDPDTGLDYPFVHIYDVAVLRRMRDGNGRPRFEGQPLEAAARAAFRAGLSGLIVYNFTRGELLNRIVKAYDRHSTDLTAADSGGPPPRLALNIEPEDAAILCAQWVKNRNTFTHGWRTATPFLHYPGASSRSPTAGGRTVIVGSFRLVPLTL